MWVVKRYNPDDQTMFGGCFGPLADEDDILPFLDVLEERADARGSDGNLIWYFEAFEVNASDSTQHFPIVEETA